MANYRISAVVCTYNRADLLPLCLKALCEQSLPTDDYEILVIDNASTDNTAQIVADFIRTYPQHHIQRIYETQQGLSYARNTAWRIAQSPYIAYIDDDALADEHWLKFALEALETTPKPLCVSGEVGVFYTTPKPFWFKDSYEIITFGDAYYTLKYGEVFGGLNMIWDKTVLEQYNGFVTDRGVSGDILSVGEETDLFMRIWHSDPQPIFLYHHPIAIQHYLPPIKTTVRYRFRRGFVAGQIVAKEAIIKQRMTPRNRFNTVIKQTWLLSKLSMRAIMRGRHHTFWQQWLTEDIVPLIEKMGLISAMMGINVRFRRD